MDAASDAELVARCRAGDQAAWEALVDRYSRYVHAIVSRVYHLESHDAEDAFQDVFTRVFERLDTLRDGSALRPTLTGCPGLTPCVLRTGDSADSSLKFPPGRVTV